MYKSRLNELCQKNRWASPMYSFIKDGEEHSPVFKGLIVVNGFTFVSQSIFKSSKSSKSAYNDAAQQALNHFTTFTLSPADMQNAKRQKVSIISSTGSKSYNDVPSKTNVSPTLEEDKTTTTTPPDNMKGDGYVLCNKARVHTSIPITVLPKGSVVLPIGDNKWTIVSLDSN